MKHAIRPGTAQLVTGLAFALWACASPVRAAVTVPAPPSEAPAPAARPNPSDLPLDDHPLDGRVLDELARRKSSLDRRERELELRESRIAAAEVLARGEVVQLNKLRAELDKMVSQQTAGADADLTLLAGLYSNMKPAQAAAILSKLEVPKAAAILRRLETKLAGPVLASMEPSIAAGITRELQHDHDAFQR